MFVYKDLTALVDTIFVVITEILGSLKAFYFVQNMKILQQLMKNINCDIFQPKTLEQKRLVQPILALWKIIYILYWFPVTSTLTSWAVFPILDGSSKIFRLPFAAWYPYNTNISPWYELTYVYQVVGVWFLAISTLNIDTLILALMTYTSAQSVLLCNSVKNLKTDAMQSYNTKLLKCIVHHKKLIM